MIDLLNQSKDLHQEYSIQLNHSCLSDRDGHTSFHLTAEQSGQSHVARLGEEGIEVPNLLLDQYCQDHDYQIDFAKIDLKGRNTRPKGMELITKQNPKALTLKSFQRIKPDMAMNNAPVAFLESLGYSSSSVNR